MDQELLTTPTYSWIWIQMEEEMEEEAEEEAEEADQVEEPVMETDSSRQWAKQKQML